MSIMNRHKIAVIGLDNWYHAFPLAKYSQLDQRLELVGVSDPNIQKIKEFQNKFAIPEIYTDWHQLLELCPCEMVMVSSATVDHAEIVREAAKLGKHILCDKPMAMNFVEANQIISVCKENNVSLAMIHNYRFSPVLQAVKSHLDSGVIGKISSITINSRAPLPEDWPGSNNPGWYADPAKSCGGGFIDHAAHVIDAIIWFMDEQLPVSVIGTMANLLPEKMSGEDHGIAILNYKKTEVIVQCCWIAPSNLGYIEYLQINGLKGEIFVSRSAHPYIEIRSSDDNFRLQRFELEEPDWTVIFIEVIESFLDSLEKDQPISTPGSQGMNATHVIDAIYQSARTGVKVIL